ncbi:MAG: energy transducer TonB [Methylocystis sp.]|uniref:energy transducer TonB n=1 Tax=Methylocystis sp. TaxID=1911079 RepID=UPI003DA499A3
MNVLTCGRVALACALAFSGAAVAQTQKPAPAQPAPKPAAPAAPTAPAAPAQKPAAPNAPAQAPAQAPAAMSESKYLSLLYSEIAKHTPEVNPAGPGEVTASFVVGPAGKVVKVTIDKTTSPAHAEIVRKILSQIVTPPPPGGSMDIGQTFKFRANQD